MLHVHSKIVSVHIFSLASNLKDKNVKNATMVSYQFHVIPLVNKSSLWHFACSLRLGFHLATYNPSNIRRLRDWRGALQIVVHVNLCSISLSWARPRLFALAARCLAGSDIPLILSCSANRTCSHRAVSPIYSAPHEQTPL